MLNSAAGEPKVAATIARLLPDLVIGRFGVYLYEWAALDNIDVEEWITRVQAACDAVHIPVAFDRRNDVAVVVVFNPTRTPRVHDVNAFVKRLIQRR
jgi:hypothetical protein